MKATEEYYVRRIAELEAQLVTVRADEREKAKEVIRELMHDPAVVGNKARLDVLLQALANISEAAQGGEQDA